ncbi:endonuclease domain-containing protein [Sphingomonas lutea]|uniref:endonuclease domain-containing protein n=1 Tax=Sphingomonas lutea TaxID=1045317 RepID=UPI0031E90BEE
MVASTAAFARAKWERRSGNLPEVVLWRELRKRPGAYKFRRQHPISNCVVDFACLDRRLVIEIDGAAHDRGNRPERDVRRDAFLRSRGFEVIRIPAREILSNLAGAIAAIVLACDQRSPLHHQPAAGGPPPRSGEICKSQS